MAPPKNQPETKAQRNARHDREDQEIVSKPEGKAAAKAVVDALELDEL